MNLYNVQLTCQFDRLIEAENHKEAMEQMEELYSQERCHANYCKISIESIENPDLMEA